MNVSDIFGKIINQYNDLVQHCTKCTAAASACTSQRKYTVKQDGINFDVMVAFEKGPLKQDTPSYAFKVIPSNKFLEKSAGAAIKEIENISKKNLVLENDLLNPRFGTHNT